MQRQRWQQHCESFNDHTNTRKLWATFRGKFGKTTSTHITRWLRLHLRCTPQELSLQFKETELPQATNGGLQITASTLSPHNHFGNVTEGEGSPFNIAELIAALKALKNNTAPGPAGVPSATLRNLPEQGPADLLQKYNEIWAERNTPADRKLFRVIHIPNPGMDMNDVRNQRPSSLI